MAQRTVHYLFGEIISRHVELNNKERFLLGSIMPDGIIPADRDRAHFKVSDESSTYFDFEAFGKRFLKEIKSDDMYLGYYMHLLEDAFYRDFVYGRNIPMPKLKEEVALLHRDYHILNSYIVNKYGILNILKPDYDLSNEPITELAEFILPDFLAAFAEDFTEQWEGSTTFISGKMVDEFISEYVALATEEVRSIKNGAPRLKTRDYTWSKKQLV